MVDENTIVTLESHIRDLEQEVIDTKKMVNRLLKRDGQAPRYPDAALTADAGNVLHMRPDKFYNQSLATSIREYLKGRNIANLGPTSMADIYEALCKGGYKFETENEDNRKKNLKVCLQKNTALFHKLPGNTFGLTEWYGIKTPEGSGKVKKLKTRKKPRGTPSGNARASRKRPAARHGDQEVTESAASAEATAPMTVKEALRAAVLAMKGEFTKQNVVDWIEKHHPTLKAEQRKSSIFSMIATLKDELKIKTAHAGKGKEPHTFMRETQ